MSVQQCEAIYIINFMFSEMYARVYDIWTDRDIKMEFARGEMLITE